MNGYINKKNAESALEYELNYLGLRNEVIVEAKARLANPNWPPHFSIQDQQWVGPDKMDVSVHIGTGPGGELQITSYDFSFKGIQCTFDRDGLFWPTLKQAKNLLEGASVGRSIISPINGNLVVQWFRLDKDWQRVTGHYRLENLGFFDLQRELDLLPIPERHYSNGLLTIYSDLLNGDKPSVHYAHFSVLDAKLEVDAITQCVEVRNKEGEVLAISTASAIADQAVGNGANYSTSLNYKIMRNKEYSEENFLYNVIRLRQHGFPNTKFKELKEKMQNGESRIFLEFHAGHYVGNVRAVAHVEKADTGVYFPNRYELELKNPNSKYSRRQFFQIHNFKGHDKKYDIPWKSGVNLLRGGQILNHWLNEDKSSIYEWRGLDFSGRTIAGHGYIAFEAKAFDVQNKLDQLPVQEKDRNDLRHSYVVRAIEMGESQGVHLESDDNTMIRLRANVPKRELDIIKDGHVISLDQLNAEMANRPTQGVYIGDARKEQGTGSLEKGNTAVEGQSGPFVIPSGSPDNPVKKADLPTLLKAGKEMGNVMILGLNGLQTSDKAMKVLTGNPITPSPAGHKGNIKSQGI